MNDKEKRNDKWAWWVDDVTGKGTWLSIKNNETTVENGHYTLFYFNGRIAEMGRLKEKKKVDTTFYFDIAGNSLCYKLNVSDTERFYYYKDGDCKFYYYDGKFEGEGVVKNHHQGDKWIRYYKNGKVSYKSELINGIGLVSRYFANGKPKSIEYWNDSTNVYFVLKEWYENGQPMFDYNAQNGINSGVVKHYFPNGNLKKIYTLNDGKSNGVFKSFYENGQEEQEKTDLDDKAQGSIRSWYENGHLKLKGEMKNGIKNGLWTTYRENGTILSTANLKMEKLDGLLVRFDIMGKMETKELYKNGVRIK